MSAAIEQAVNCVLSLFLIGLVGYVLDRRGWFGPETRVLVPRLVTLITLPPYLFVNIITTFSHDELIHLVYGVLVPAASILLTYALGWLTSRLLRVRRGRRGLFRVGYATSNTIFIGLPVNVALFGVEALPYVLLYFFANTTFFWTAGNYSLSLDGERPPERVFSRETAKRLFSPPLIGFLLGVLAVLAEIRPPAFFVSAAGYVGGLTIPLAIIFIGLTLASANLRQLTLDRDVVGLLLGRFLISPLTVILILRLVDLPPLMAKVFIIQSSLPVITSAVLLAGYHRTDTAYASVVVSLSTLLSLATIPLYMVVVTLMFG